VLFRILRDTHGVKNLGVVFLFLFLLSCGGEKSQRVSLSQGPHSFLLGSSESAQDVIQKWVVKCADSQNCPNTVGQLTVPYGDQILSCTATLIANNMILTNSHCFDVTDPETQRFVKPELLCQNGVSVVFPENSPSGKDVVRCHRLVKKSFVSLHNRNPDYLLFEIDRSLRRGYDKVSRAGVPDRMSLMIRKVNPLRKGYGELVVEKCESRLGTLLIPEAQDSHFQIQALTGCEVKPGNSGSSLVDDKGLIRGLIHAAVTSQFFAPSTPLRKTFLKKALELKTSMMTNATCMDYPFEESETFEKKKCSQYFGLEEGLSSLLNLEKFQEMSLERIQWEFQSLEHPQFGYKLTSNGTQSMAFPACIRPSFAEKVRRGEKPKGASSAPLYQWTTEIQVNNDLRPEPRLTKRKLNCALSWNPQELKSSSSAVMNLYGQFCVNASGQASQQKEYWDVCQFE